MADKLDLNRATVTDLEKISGVTRVLARRIIAARDKKGGFVTINTLRDINGVTADLVAVMTATVAVEGDSAKERKKMKISRLAAWLRRIVRVPWLRGWKQQEVNWRRSNVPHPPR